MAATDPHVAAEMTRLPPFVRDTDLRLLLRSYYLNARNANETLSEAWAGGAWLTYRSGWLLDTFQMGATVFSAVPLYAPSHRDGTLLLAPGQEGLGRSSSRPTSTRTTTGWPR